MRLNKTQQEAAEKKVSDKALPLPERRKAYEDLMETMLNPKKTFDPVTFDPMDDDPDYEVKRRLRLDPPKRLPTLGLKPKQILEGQLVGMYESKQDLYLLIAWLSERVSDLEDQLNNQQ